MLAPPTHASSFVSSLSPPWLGLDCLGIPQVAAALAQLTHAPRLVVLNEIGLADPHPVEFGVGNSDPRHWYRAAYFGSFIDVMGSVLHRGLVDSPTSLRAP